MKKNGFYLFCQVPGPLNVMKFFCQILAPTTSKNQFFSHEENRRKQKSLTKQEEKATCLEWGTTNIRAFCQQFGLLISTILRVKQNLCVPQTSIQGTERKRESQISSNDFAFNSRHFAFVPPLFVPLFSNIILKRRAQQFKPQQRYNNPSAN